MAAAAAAFSEAVEMAAAYYAWRVETYTGIAAEEVSWRVVMGLLRGSENRRALRRYAAWLGRMRRLRGR